MPPDQLNFREAATRLAAIDARRPERDELADAFRQVWFASADWQDWPRDLCREAEGLFAVFFRRGRISDSVTHMTDAEARSAVQALRRFLDSAERSTAPRKPR